LVAFSCTDDEMSERLLIGSAYAGQQAQVPNSLVDDPQYHRGGTSIALHSLIPERDLKAIKSSQFEGTNTIHGVHFARGRGFRDSSVCRSSMAIPHGYSNLVVRHPLGEQLNGTRTLQTSLPPGLQDEHRVG
jgi:hypothetical protein